MPSSESAPATEVSPRRRRGRRVSVATRLAAAVVMVSALAIAVTSLVGLRAGIAATDRLLERRLESVRNTEQFELVSMINSNRRAVQGLAASPMTASAIDQFSTGFRTLDLPDRATLANELENLAGYSARVVVPQVALASEGPVGPRDLLPGTEIGVHLQYLFLPGDGHDRAAAIDDPGGDSEWAAIHTDLHPHYRSVAARLGVDDLYLVNAAGDIVYSVEKAPDFATNLVIGVQSGSTLATTFRKFLDGVDEPVVTDLSAYPPAGARPTWFHAAPVRVDGALVGMVVVRLGVEPLNDVLAAGNQLGVGDTGEAYLAGADNRLRSDPRRFRESPTAYLGEATGAGTLADADADLIRARGSTALVQLADGDVVRSAAAAPTDILRRNDHLGRDSYMAATPLGIDGLDWVLVAQLTHDEAVQPVNDYRRILLAIAAVLVTLVTFGGVAWANRVVHPIRLVSERLRDRQTRSIPPGSTIAATPAASTITTESIDARSDEFARLVAGFSAMEAELVVRRSKIEGAHQQWLDVLRGLLPAAVAERIDEGDRSMFDRVPLATVTVLVLHGGTGTDAGDDTGTGTARSGIDRFLDVIDSAADRHGVERVKLVGDSCFTAVGHQQPLLDHARRAVMFAREVVQVLDDAPGDLRAGIGIATGPVNVGLGGSARLVYDVWGATVAEAYALARRAAPGTVMMGPRTAERLPDDLVVAADLLNDMSAP